MSAPFSAPISTVSITAGGTSQVLLAAADSTTPRKSIIVQPQTEACLLNWGGQTAGTQATGTYTLAAKPSINDQLLFNGVTFTFVASSASNVQITIGSTLATAITNALAILNASANASVNVATYSNASGSPADGIITVTYIAGGTTGNGYTLGTSGGNVTRSAATLANGSNTVGGIALALNQIAIFSAADFPSVEGEIQVLSATTASKVGIGYGQG
jgi:hypothetical protein